MGAALPQPDGALAADAAGEFTDIRNGGRVGIVRFIFTVLFYRRIKSKLKINLLQDEISPLSTTALGAEDSLLVGVE